MQTSEKQTKKIIKRTHRTNKKMEKKNQTFASARAAGKRRADCRRTWQTESKSIEAYPILDTLTHSHTHTHLQRMCAGISTWPWEVEARHKRILHYCQSNWKTARRGRERRRTARQTDTRLAGRMWRHVLFAIFGQIPRHEKYKKKKKITTLHKIIYAYGMCIIEWMYS